MKKLIKNIDKKEFCLIVITLSVLIGVGFYCWSIYKEQIYFQKQADCVKDCISTLEESEMSYTKIMSFCKDACKYKSIWK